MYFGVRRGVPLSIIISDHLENLGLDNVPRRQSAIHVQDGMVGNVNARDNREL